MVDVVHRVGHGLFSQFGYGVHGCHFHLFVDGFCVYVESSAEDVGEADDVVYLVGVVGATGGHDYVRTGFDCFVVGYFGYGIGQCEHYRIGIH